MALTDWLGAFRRRFAGRPSALPALVEPGSRVRLRTPLASTHRVWIPAGAAGVVVGWDSHARSVSIELDTPRTVITVPWAWIEAEPPPAESADPSPSG
jgi:hypothetical protein